MGMRIADNYMEIIAQQYAAQQIAKSKSGNSTLNNLNQTPSDILDISTSLLSKSDADIAILMGTHVSAISDTLQSMRDISVKAQDASISEDERLGLQIQMVQLQADLHKNVYGMGSTLADKEYKVGWRDTDFKRLPNGFYDTSDWGSDMGASSFDDLNPATVWVRNGKRRVSYFVTHPAGEDPLKLGVAYENLKIGKIIVERQPTDRFTESGTMTSHIILEEAEPWENDIRSTTEKQLELLDNARSDGKTPGKTLGLISKEEVFAGNKVILSDSEKARIAVAKMDLEIKKLNDFIKKFHDFLKNQSPDSRNDESDQRSESKQESKTGTQSQSTVLGNIASFGSDPFDFRLTTTNGKLGELFKELDAFLKDSVYANIGTGKNSN